MAYALDLFDLGQFFLNGVRADGSNSNSCSGR
jgi:hypothetical protein